MKLDKVPPLPSEKITAEGIFKLCLTNAVHAKKDVVVSADVTARDISHM